MASWEFNRGMTPSPSAVRRHTARTGPAGPWLGWVLVGMLLLLAAPALPATRAAGAEPSPLKYDPETGHLEARIEGVPLSRVLGMLARVSGWEIRVEPGPDPQVTTGFSPRPAREGLPRLLGGLDFSLTASTNGPTRLLVYRTGAGSATEKVPADPADRLANHLVVRLAPGSGLDPEALARELGATLRGSIPSLEAHLFEFPDPEAAEAARSLLEGRDGVVAVEDNWRIDAPELPGNTRAVGPPTLRIRPGDAGSDRHLVAVVDTAIQPLGTAYEAFVVDRASVRPGTPTGSDPTHGTTMVARLLAAAESTLGPDRTANLGVLGVNVYGDQNQTSSFDVARGVVVAVERGAGIVNLSLGGPTPSPVLHDALLQASRRGVLVISAAGNVPSYDPTFPAGFPEVLGVTAGMPNGGFAPYANRSSTVDLILQGTGLVPYGGSTWRVSGTSVAAAHASGVAAALWLREGGTPAALRPLLLRTYGLPAGSGGR